MEEFIIRTFNRESVEEIIKLYIKIALFTDDPQDMFFASKLILAYYSESLS